MLDILISESIFDDTIYAIDGYFDSAWEPAWIDSEYARRIIPVIDKSMVVAPRIIDSPFLGYVDPTYLSGGVKCLLCLYFLGTDNWKFDITVCGDNCAPFIQELGMQKDLKVQLSYLMPMRDDKLYPIYVRNVDRVVNNFKEFMQVFAGVKL